MPSRIADLDLQFSLNPVALTHTFIESRSRSQDPLRNPKEYLPFEEVLPVLSPLHRRSVLFTLAPLMDLPVADFTRPRKETLKPFKL